MTRRVQLASNAAWRKGRYPFLLAFVLFTFAPLTLLAHPMGNFSINHYSGITLTRDSLELRYIIDMAEIPTFQELHAAGIKADPQDPHISAYLRAKADEFWKGIALKLDGKPVELQCAEQQVIFPPGAGGLPTMKFGFTCKALLSRLKAGPHRLEYRDDNFRERAGWKEVVIHADPELQVATTAPSQDRSSELSNYPTDLINSPPQDLGASATFTMPAPVVAIHPAPTAAKPVNVAKPYAPTLTPASHAPKGVSPPTTTALSALPKPLVANVQGTPRNAFTQLITAQNLSIWFLIGAAFIAMGLGALHALEPGHGKTLVAAYLVGSRGTAWHAVVLGTIVTIAHTAGVYALGALTLYASRYILPEKLYPWLGVTSGLIIVGLGVLLFLRRWAGEDPSLKEDHKHWYDHISSSTRVSSGPEERVAQTPQPISARQLLILGITGGMIPCPAALVVLLSAVALHRIALGFFLIIAFSVGLAAVLIGTGLLMVHAGRLISRWNPNSQLFRRYLPLVSAVFITTVGLALLAQSLKSAGVAIQIGSLAGGKWLLIAGIGLLLGMRHSTDPDHVIAVTTIVTRLRSLRHASLVGMLWGVGHTLTIFMVGSGIILFGIVIPPRLGLSLEFAVALMLILLGVLNLTGLLARFTNRQIAEESPRESTLRRGVANSERLLDRLLSRFGAYQLIRPLAIGLVHGLAGSAAVALLVLATIHNPLWAIAYLLLFGLGTIAGMMLMTVVIALPVVWTGKNFTRLNRYMCATSGIVSVAFGLFLVYQIGFVSGLFSAVPKWIPE
jgi:ABC-type nickel/cobalt efflux system permease component RcnA